MYRDVELVALYALLHDIGKPMQRFLRRVRKGFEKESVESALKALSEFLGKSPKELLDVADQIRHDEITDLILSTLSKWGIQLEPRIREIVEDAVRKADVMAASERRFGEPYELSTLMYSIVREVLREAGLGFEYEFETAPLLVPTWTLKIANYQDYVGLKRYLESHHGAGDLVKHKELVNEFISAISDLINELEVCKSKPDQCDSQAIKKHVKEILVDKAGATSDSIWLSIKPLTARSILDLEAKTIKEAIENSSYADVVEKFITKLNSLLDLYQLNKPRIHGVGKAFINSLDQLLKYSCLLVPSAVYATITPDISLYGHSKLAAAYASSLITSYNGKVRLLTIDSNQIQQFISSPQKAGGASRVLRGRSLLVELALDALSMYTLALFNDIPRCNIIVSEGGTLDIIVPDFPDFERRIDKLRRVANDLSLIEFAGRLGFTIAYSKGFNIEEIDFLSSLVKGGGFYDILESLSLKLALAKSNRLMREPLYIDPSNIVDFDAITREPVTKDELDPGEGLKLGFRVDESTVEYSNQIAGPNKLNVGDVISKITHLSLIGGTLARNLVGVIGIYVYRSIEDLVLPDEEMVSSITKELAKEICGEYRFMCDIEAKGIKVGFIPLSKAGALYVLISTKEPKNPLTGEYAQQLWSAVTSFLQIYVDRFADLFRQTSNKIIRMDVKTVNTFIDFVPSVNLDVFNAIKNAIVKLLDMGIGVSFSSIVFNSWHPFNKKESRLKDLDEYDIIAIGKMDCDKLGDVRHLMSYSPSRLVTFSELLNIIMAGKSYLRLFENLELYGDVITLYAGGDDAVFYGDWISVIPYMARVYGDVRRALPPLTFSVGITIDKNDAPLLLLYNDAVELLEEAKSVSRAACALKLSNPILVPVPGKNVYELIDVIPLESPSKSYPWITDETSSWNFMCLAQALTCMQLGEKTDECREFKNALATYKRDAYLLSLLGSKFARAVENTATGRTVDTSSILQVLVPLELEYAYMWARRGDALRIIVNALSNICGGAKIYAWPDDIAGSIQKFHTAFRLLLAAKPILDHVLLSLRKMEEIR
jgi:CRISPR-associated protein Cas10/Csm1 subtype III-A